MTAESTALITRLNAAANCTADTQLSGLLRWAVTHITEQNEALNEATEEAESEHNERIRLETALHALRGHLQAADMALREAMPVYLDFSRDASAHINLMGMQHKDPDYMGAGGLPVPHIDTTDRKLRKANVKK